MSAPTAQRVPKSRRRHHYPWTREEDVLLRARWGEDGARTMVEKFGRTQAAIYQRAKVLGLPAQSQGKGSCVAACRALGLVDYSIRLLARECGVTLVPRAPVSKGVTRRYVGRAYDAVQLGALLSQRDTRTQTPRAWSRTTGRYHEYARDHLRPLGLLPPEGRRGTAVRVPVEVFGEMIAGVEGPWSALWRAVIAVPATERPCAPWLLALAAYDLAEGGAAAEWVEPTVSQQIAGAARALARRVLPRAEERRAA